MPVIEVLESRSLLGAGLQTGYDSFGLSTLSYNSVQLVNTNTSRGRFTVSQYKLIEPDGSIIYGQDWQGGQTVAWDAAHRRLTWSYRWGAVTCTYVESNNRLDLVVGVTNTTTNETVAGIDVYAMRLNFPNALPGPAWPIIRFGVDAPPVSLADYGTGALAVVNEDPTRRLYSGLYTETDSATTHRYNLLIGSTPFSYNPTDWPVFDRPVAPGQSDTYDVSLRFGPSGSSAPVLAPDAYQKFAADYPSTLTWLDRRAICKLFPCGSSPDGRSATNPRGWFNDPAVDVTTPAGLVNLHTRLLQWADTAVSICTQMNAQGVITWDVEGEQWAQPTTYIGDPRLTSALAPETDYLNVIDQYFQKFRDAGLRVGVTIRPQELVFDAHGIPTQETSPDPAQTLIDKIDYARQRWSCTLFYVDSNTGYDAGTFERVAAVEPGVLLIPEHEDIRHFASTAPYNELRQGYISTSAETRTAYPHPSRCSTSRMAMLRPTMMPSSRPCAAATS